MADLYRGFHIYYDPPPIPSRAHDWHAEHEDYDGAPLEPGGSPGDDRYLHGPTREAVMAEVDRWWEEAEDVASRAAAPPEEPDGTPRQEEHDG